MTVIGLLVSALLGALLLVVGRWQYRKGASWLRIFSWLMLASVVYYLFLGGGLRIFQFFEDNSDELPVWVDISGWMIWYIYPIATMVYATASLHAARFLMIHCRITKRIENFIFKNHS